MFEREWYFDGFRLPEAPSHSETDSDDNPMFSMSNDKSILVLTNTNENRIGRYECRVVDQNGQIVMKAHHLLRKLLEPETTIIPTTSPSRGM